MQLEVDPATARALVALARANKITVAEVVRRLVAAALEQKTRYRLRRIVQD
jgi:hypothetical protein